MNLSQVLDAAIEGPVVTNGGFWLDRRRRSTHRLPATRRSDTPERRARLWDWVAEMTGCQVPGAGSA